MRSRNGQVAVYLVLVLVALAVLMMMNVSAFLSVRSKNRMMNAVDAAAIAVANWQGDRLNRLGEMNVRHLRALIRPAEEESWSGEDVLAMRELATFDPLEGIAIGNRTAAAWGFDAPVDDEIADCFRQHLNEIISDYCNNPDLYPEYREGQWADTAAKLGSLLGEGLIVAPGYMEMANGWSQEPLLSGAFYDAIAARAWCWFGIGGRSRYFDLDSKTMPRPEFAEPRVQENSEIYSLHVTFKTWMDSAWADEYVPNVGFSMRWTNFVCQVTGCTVAELAAAPRAADPTEIFAFYDSRWHAWSQPRRYFAGFGPDDFPIAGNVKPEYDVAGCVASCIMLGHVTRLVGETSSERSMIVTAEAKPLGTLTVEGELRPVTAFGSFIAPSAPGERIFTEAQLVLMHSVPRDPGVSLSPEWYRHVKEHLPRYFTDGPTSEGGCYFCQQLKLWEDPEFRARARDWLMRNGESCRTGGGPGDEKGGYDWAH